MLHIVLNKEERRFYLADEAGEKWAALCLAKDPSSHPAWEAEALTPAELWALVASSEEQVRAAYLQAASAVCWGRTLEELEAIRGSAQLTQATELAIVEGLSEVQARYVRGLDRFCGPGLQKAIAQYLRNGVPVRIVAQNEVPEAGAYALVLQEDPEFWLGCFQTEGAAQSAAEELGLPLIQVT